MYPSTLSQGIVIPSGSGGNIRSYGGGETPRARACLSTPPAGLVASPDRPSPGCFSCLGQRLDPRCCAGTDHTSAHPNPVERCGRHEALYALPRAPPSHRVSPEELLVQGLSPPV